jgi:tripeptide aminopeptidase
MRELIQEKRVVQEFCELVSIDSLSFHERQMADILIQKCQELNIDIKEDDAGKHYQSHAGNLYASIPGTLEGEPLLFCAHMDTVEPGIAKKPIIKDRKITSQGNTVLGSDDVAGIVAILESIRILKEHHIPHRTIEIIFPIAEEAYIKGSQVFDYTKIKSKQAYILDLSGDMGRASLQEPTLLSFQIEVIGKASHAGFSPEKGIHSIALTSQAITQIPQGRIDEETTVNIGKITGGTATNIIPESTIIEGEIRSFNHDKAIQAYEQITHIFKSIVNQHNAQLRTHHQIHLKAYKVSLDEPVVQRFINICHQLNVTPQLTKTLGGSDNNSFMQNGIKGIVLASGMNQVHTTNEYIYIDDLLLSIEMILSLMTSEE